MEIEHHRGLLTINALEKLSKRSPSGIVAAVSTAVSVRFIGSTVYGTTLGLVGKAFWSVEFLLSGAENKVILQSEH